MNRITLGQDLLMMTILVAALVSIFAGAFAGGVATGRIEMFVCAKDAVADQFGPAVDAAVFSDAISEHCKP